MSDAPDKQILRYARDNGYVVVTLDADFHQLLALSNASLPSAIRIRLKGLHGPELASIIRDLSDRAAGELETGSAITVDAVGQGFADCQYDGDPVSSRPSRNSAVAMSSNTLVSNRNPLIPRPHSCAAHSIDNRLIRN